MDFDEYWKRNGHALDWASCSQSKTIEEVAARVWKDAQEAKAPASKPAPSVGASLDWLRGRGWEDELLRTIPAALLKDLSELTHPGSIPQPDFTPD